MAPIFILDTSRIRPGRAEDVRIAFAGLAAFVESHEPRVLAYGVYLDPHEPLITVLQVHPDAASAEFHMKVGAEEFRKFADLLDLEYIHVYGTPGSKLLRSLQRKAEMLGGKEVIVHDLQAGLMRFPDAAP
jgi:hypothetical protein